MGVEWRESLAIGVDEIDNQHKELLLRFDGLLRACREGRGIGELKGLLGFLDEYVVEHFRDEERLQQLHRYPGLAEHRRLHASFIARVKALKDEISADGVAVHNVIETNNLLLNWLVNHISVVDRELGKFLQAAALRH